MLENIQSTQISQAVKAGNSVTTNAQNKLNEAGQNKEQDFDFEDFLDILNPLQHIPIVSSLYQDQTQDEISNDAKAVGDVFYGILTGGVFGVLSAVGNAILKQETDKDVGEHLIAFVAGEGEENSIIEQVASETEKGSATIQEASSLGTIFQDLISSDSINSDSTALDSKAIDNNIQNPNAQNIESSSQKDDYWSIRMKQIFGDDEDLG